MLSLYRGSVPPSNLFPRKPRQPAVTAKEFEPGEEFPGWVSQKCSATVKQDMIVIAPTLHWRALMLLLMIPMRSQQCTRWHADALAKTSPSGDNELVNIVQNLSALVQLGLTVPPNAVSNLQRKQVLRVLRSKMTRLNRFLVESVIFTLNRLYNLSRSELKE